MEVTAGIDVTDAFSVTMNVMTFHPLLFNTSIFLNYRRRSCSGACYMDVEYIPHKIQFNTYIIVVAIATMPPTVRCVFIDIASLK